MFWNTYPILDQSGKQNHNAAKKKALSYIFPNSNTLCFKLQASGSPFANTKIRLNHMFNRTALV